MSRQFRALLFAASMTLCFTLVGCGGGGAPGRVPVDSPLVNFEPPSAEELAAEDTATPTDDAGDGDWGDGEDDADADADADGNGGDGADADN